MKKLLTLFLLLGTLAAQCQTITEKDLLGTWQNTYITMLGCTVDVKTGEVTLSDEVKKEAEESGKSIEQTKAVLATMIGQFPLTGAQFVFNPEFNMEFRKDGVVKPSAYKLIEKDGKTTLLITEAEVEFGLGLTDTVLELYTETPNIDAITIGLQKVK